MSFFAVLLALVIEQARALPRDNPVEKFVIGWAQWARRNFDAGRERHAWVVWAATVVVPGLAAMAVYLALRHYSVLLALLFDVGVLYFTLGFRRFSHWFTEIRDALERGDEVEARQVLARWRRIDASELARTELLRQVIEHALIAAHRNVFGVFFWFVVLSSLGLGPAGALIYRMTGYAASRAAAVSLAPDERLRAVSSRMAEWIDFVPARLTAFGFAVVGNFEEAINAWRRDGMSWARGNDAVILASAAGAVGVQLGSDAGAYTDGEPPKMAHLRSIVGLVWRSVVLWMLLLALLTLAHLVG